MDLNDRIKNYLRKKGKMTFSEGSFIHENKTKLQANTELEISNLHYEKIKDLVATVTNDQLRQMYESMATPGEDLILSDMLGYMTNPIDVFEFMNGAHIQLEGRGHELYNKWLKTCDEEVIPRKSSHKSSDTQWGLNGNVLGHALVGTRHTNPKDQTSAKYTWIQLESNPIGGWKQFIQSPRAFIVSAVLHMLDFFQYVATKQNISRWGKSKYTEAKPLKIDISKVTPAQHAERQEIWRKILIEQKGDVKGLEARMKKAGIKIPTSVSNKLKKS